MPRQTLVKKVSQQLPPKGYILKISSKSVLCFTFVLFQSVHCTIKMNSLYCDTVSEEKEWVTFRDFILSLQRKVNIPDMEFYWDFPDKPAYPFSFDSPPILGTIFNPRHTEIPLPSTVLIKFATEGNVYSDASTMIPWIKKENSVFFSHYKKEQELPSTAKVLEEISQSAGLFKVNEVSAEDEVSFPEKFSTASSHRMVLSIEKEPMLLSAPDVLALGSVLIRQNTEGKEWFELFLKPNEDFLQVQPSLHDVTEV